MSWYLSWQDPVALSLALALLALALGGAARRRSHRCKNCPLRGRLRP
jgi:MYXO-CTERM domain-containing protein